MRRFEVGNISKILFLSNASRMTNKEVASEDLGKSAIDNAKYIYAVSIPKHSFCTLYIATFMSMYAL
jgi:hypothetical protein